MTQFCSKVQYIIGLIAITALTFTSCKKDDTRVFDQSADERLTQRLEQYQQALLSAADGWNAVYSPAAGGTYNFYFRFNAENRVFMYSDFDTATAKNEKESSYRLKGLQQPALIFDTYSYIHLLADPDGSINGGEDGQGLLADFEFAIDSVFADSITLTGRVNRTKLTLQKATAQDRAAWDDGDWAGALLFTNISLIQNYFKTLTLNGVKYEVRLDPVTKTVTFLWLSGGTLQQHTTTYSFESGGVVLDEPMVNGSQTISGFTDISWNDGAMTLGVKAGNLTGTIAGDIKPLKTDLAAAERWWQFSVDNGYWESIFGFHANGVDDAFNITSLGRYYRLIYWSEYDPGNDLFAPLFVNAAGTGLELKYGAAPGKPTVTPDGRAVFSLLGVYGTYPTSGPAYETLLQLLIPEGYYFIQTGETTYDMVSADDAKTWLTWQF